MCHDLLENVMAKTKYVEREVTGVWKRVGNELVEVERRFWPKTVKVPLGMTKAKNA